MTVPNQILVINTYEYVKRALPSHAADLLNDKVDWAADVNVYEIDVHIFRYRLNSSGHSIRKRTTQLHDNKNNKIKNSQSSYGNMNADAHMHSSTHNTPMYLSLHTSRQQLSD
jgi:hypothetical protein